eukprot:235680-Amphidinium_carterae.1
MKRQCAIPTLCATKSLKCNVKRGCKIRMPFVQHQNLSSNGVVHVQDVTDLLESRCDRPWSVGATARDYIAMFSVRHGNW